ncbi:hypothetical protein LCGC14_1191970 [marine sediment metagenome]|uniref:Uncharacterized protein n=1 Tax=marine sediment metagenome TaxID=412755 RepID=A0A0F9P1S0_9ZZZZ
MPAKIDYYTELCLRLYHDLPVVTGTNTGTNASNIVDVTGLLNYSSGDTNFYDGVYARLVGTDDVSSGDSRVTRGGWTVTGTLVVDPDFSTTPVSGDLYTLSRHPPKLLDDAINRLLRNTYAETFWPLSLHVMGNDANDMESSGLDGDYSKSASATLSAETTKVNTGGQSMKVTASAATQYAYTADIPVNESQSLYAAVLNAVDTGDSAEFRIVNVDDSNAAIENATNDEVAWMELVFNFTPPSGCERIQAWMISTENTDVSYWDDFQIWHGGAGVYPMPSWLTRPAQLLDVRAFPQGTPGPALDFDYRTHEQGSIPLTYNIESVDKRANQPFRLKVQGTSSRPYIYALRPLAELSADTSTSVAEQDFIVRWAEKLVREPDKAAETLALLRAVAFGRVTTELPTRAGVSMR